MAALHKYVTAVNQEKLHILSRIIYRRLRLLTADLHTTSQKFNIRETATNISTYGQSSHYHLCPFGRRVIFCQTSDRGNLHMRYHLRLFATSIRNLDIEKDKHVAQTNTNIQTEPVRQKHTDPPFPSLTESKTGTFETNMNKVVFRLPNPELDWEYIISPDNEENIQQNITDRKGVGDIKKVKRLWNKLNFPEEIEDEDHEDKTQIKRQLMKEAMDLPNKTHPDVPLGDESQNRLVETVSKRRAFSFQPKSVVQLGEQLGMLRTENLGHTTGPKTYYLMGGFAQLEQALIRYTVDRMEKHGFKLVSVPDLIHPDIVERCGFKTTGDRTQVYKLDPNSHGDVALAGTGEMPIAGMFMGQKIDAKELPKKVMTVSRCYRAETSDVEEERGIYRVHQFTKVESFGVTSQETGMESEELLNELLSIQKGLFSELGLHFRILDMASQELGAPAYRKYDMETWMPAKQFWGEISSTSNCIDYQSRRLGIKYTLDGTSTFAHTINGTACAIPRMIMAIVENNQLKDGRVSIPEALHPYMDGVKVFEKPVHPLIMKWIKLTRGYKARSKSP